jgi:hypothetical protein
VLSPGTYQAVAGLSNGTDDATHLNTLLDTARTAGGGLVKGLPGQTYHLSAPLIVGSNTTLDMTGCIIKVNDGVAINHIQNRAVATSQRTLSGCSITSGATSLTCATGAFAAADVGRSVYVAGAGPSAAVLCAKVSSVTSATVVVLTVAAQTTVTTATATVYDRDSNITVTGGIWDRAGGISGAAGPVQHLLRFRRVDGLTIRNVKVKSIVGKFGVNPGDVTNVCIDNVHCDLSSSIGNSGVQVGGPAERVSISRVYGTTSDDLVALTARDYPSYEDTIGDMTGVTIDGVYPNQAMCAVKIAGGTGTKYRGIAVRNVFGSTFQAPIRIWDDTASPGPTDIDGLTVQDVRVAAPDDGSGKNYSVFEITASVIGTMTVRNITWDFASTVPRIIDVSTGGNIRHLVVEGVDVLLGTASVPIGIHGTVNTLTVRAVTGRGAATYTPLVLVDTTATVGKIEVEDSSYTGGGNSSILDIYATVGSAKVSGTDSTGCDCVVRVRPSVGTFPLTLRDVRHSGYNVVQSESPVSITLSNVDPYSGCDRIVSLYGVGATPVSVYVTDVRYRAVATIKCDGSQVINVQGADAPVDVSILAKAMGDRAYNTNGALACGAGPVVSNGTNWKHLYTGSIY